MSDGLWAITSYFNPVGYLRRRTNYEVFRKHLPLPLVTVELGFGAKFELGDGDAEILVQLRGGDVMWQKERLLNLALRSLPSDCRKVVWIDCDIVVASKDWTEQVSELLDRHPILQAFSTAHFLPENWISEDFQKSSAEFNRTSAAYAVATGTPADRCFGEVAGYGRYLYSRGLVWAARRALIERHGFYDACILGSGDRAIGAACYGCFDAAISFMGMNERQSARYMKWAEPFYADVGGKTGYADADVYNLWHGAQKHRGWYERDQGLQPFGFDPYDDIMIDKNGCWRWNSDKPDMHRYVREYFVSRREDG